MNYLIKFLIIFSFSTYFIIKEFRQNYPLYLAINSYDQPQQKVEKFINESMNKLQTQFNEVNIDQFKNFKYTPNWHVTLLYIGNNTDLINSDYYKNFQENVREDIKSKTYVYVPGKLMAALVFETKIKSFNKFTHTTLALDQWNAVNSNDVMEYLFDKNGPLYEEYESGFMNSDQEFMWKFKNASLLGETVDIYVRKTNNENQMTLKAKTQKMYK